jgi:integrase
MRTHPAPWNKARLVGQKPPLKPKEIWSIRIRLHLTGNARDLALFNLALDSKLRGCDLVRLKVCDVYQGSCVGARAIVMQQKTHRPVQFEITEAAREALATWIGSGYDRTASYLFPGRRAGTHLSVRQYASLVKGWFASIGLDPSRYGTHSLRRTKATLIYRRTKNIRAVQLLLGHTKLKSTVRYLGIEVDDALEIAEQIEI